MKQYESPLIKAFGTVAELTAALGGSPDPDQSEFSQIPAGTGSFDVCDNDDTTGVC